MKRPSIGKVFSTTVTDALIIKAYELSAIEKPDSPSEEDLVQVQPNLPIENSDMISLHWLRNRIVTLRKANKLPRV